MRPQLQAAQSLKAWVWGSRPSTGTRVFPSDAQMQMSLLLEPSSVLFLRQAVAYYASIGGGRFCLDIDVRWWFALIWMSQHAGKLPVVTVG